MITFICLFFPAVISVWFYEWLTRKDLPRKQWGYVYTAAVLVVNFLCFMIKRLVLGTGTQYIFDLYNDISPSTASNYLIMAIPAAFIWPASLFFLQYRAKHCVNWLINRLRNVWNRLKPYILFYLKDYPTKKHNCLWTVLASVFLIISLLCYFSAKWYVETFGQIGFDSVLYTVMAGMGGTSPELITGYMNSALRPALLISLAVIVLFFLPVKKALVLVIKQKYHIKLYPILRKNVAIVLSVCLCIGLLSNAAVNVELFDFIYNMQNPSTLYEEQYVSADDVQIVFPKEKRNLIYIYLESMEVSFFSQKEGGALPYNVIPELRDLAEENINFSHNEQVGGFSQTAGTGWTIGAMVAQTAGIPLQTPIGVRDNHYGEYGTFLPGVKSITNILKENGYYQALLFGSDASFGGRLPYFDSHGMDRVYDHATAQTDGIIPEGYRVWWGMEDSYLFAYAKKILTEEIDTENPFSLTMLTADTHHIDGYVCDLCEDAYSEQYENVYRCSSKQVYDFVQWLQQQDFYDNTTIIIAGDHASMDGAYFERNVPADYDRRVYNCIINPAVEAVEEKNRIFTSIDMFPTTLGAIGCTIEGNRLGLGTNLFSEVPTLAETLGLEQLDRELAQFSKYYVENFHK